MRKQAFQKRPRNDVAALLFVDFFAICALTMAVKIDLTPVPEALAIEMAAAAAASPTTETVVATVYADADGKLRISRNAAAAVEIDDIGAALADVGDGQVMLCAAEDLKWGALRALSQAIEKVIGKKVWHCS